MDLKGYCLRFVRFDTTTSVVKILLNCYKQPKRKNIVGLGK